MNKKKQIEENGMFDVNLLSELHSSGDGGAT